MLSLSHVQRIFLARAPADMRKQAPGLASLVSSGLLQDPLSGDAFVFLNRHRTLVKVLVWDCSGYWVASKRLEKGRFGGKQWLAGPDVVGAVGLSIAQLLTLLEGVDIQQAAYHQHYALAPSRLAGKNGVAIIGRDS
jgi:transposase